MAVDTNKYALQALFEVLVIDLENQNATRLDELKQTTWSNGGQTQYVTGSRGGAKIIGFGAQKESMLDIQSAVLSDGLFEIQTGTDTEALTDTTELLFTDLGANGTGLVAASDAVITQYTATGTAGSEIFGVYVLNADGSLGTRVTTQVAVAPTADDEFQYTSGTKTVDFNSGFLSDGDKVVVLYYPTVASAKKFVNKTDVFAKNVKIVADGLFRNTCTGTDFWGQLVFEKAKAGEEYSFDLTEDGTPAVHNLSLEALKPCGSTNLWTLYVADSSGIS